MRKSNTLNLIFMTVSIILLIFLGNFMHSSSTEYMFAVTDKLNICPLDGRRKFICFGGLFSLTILYGMFKALWKSNVSSMLTKIAVLLTLNILRIFLIFNVFYEKNIWFASENKTSCTIELCLVLTMVILPAFMRKI